ncbi:hypothetical protein BH10BAC3_BH10BAC3_03820 [soil metagenome]
MKFFFILLFATFCGQYTSAQYFFNFSEGKNSYWSNPVNWNGGVVPPAEITSVTLISPDNTDGWTCFLDVDNVTCWNEIKVSKHTSFTVLPGITIQCRNAINVDSSAILNLHGSIAILCPIDINSNGTLNVYGGIYFDESDYCPDHGSSIASRVLNLYGSITMQRSWLYATTFLNYGYVNLGLFGHLSAEVMVNNGTIEGNTSCDFYDLTNNGSIVLTATYFGLNGLLINNNIISADESLYLKGTIVNKGDINLTSPGLFKIEDANIINYGGISSYYGSITPSVSGSINNFGFFGYTSTSSVSSEMDIINNGTFIVTNTFFNKGSVVNNKEMELSADIDTTRVKIPFINKGVLTSTGPIKLSDAFINQGQLIIQ